MTIRRLDRAAILCCHLAAILFGALALSAQPRQSSPIPSRERAAATPDQTSDAQGILAAVNAQRRERGLGALALNAHLTRAASTQARDLARGGRLSHRGSDGSMVGERVSRTGYDWSVVAENLALTTSRSPRDVVTLWMNSPGHRRNMLLRDVTEIGVAHAGTIWVLVLARPRVVRVPRREVSRHDTRTW